jgi:biopolymer transport protein ExbD
LKHGIKQVSAESAVSPNLVPMVDIMFLLLLFLMVGADIQQREREEVRLPTATSARAEELVMEDHPLVLNVHHEAEHCGAYDVSEGHEALCPDPSHWFIGIKGIDFGDAKIDGKCEGPTELAARLAGEVRDDRERRNEPAPDPRKPSSELKVMVRADRAALYKFVQRAMNSCAEVGIYKIEIGAALPAPK